jgi:hypothetical protein
MKKITVLILVMLILLSTLVSCGASGDGNAMNPGSQSPSIESTEKGDGNVSLAPDANEDYERKIIKTYNLTLETKNYESVRDAIVTAAKSLGGYIADSAEKDTVNNQGKKDRYATFTVRVPSEKVDEYVNNISQNVSVISKRLSTQDITAAYYDLESQLESLLEQEARIEKLMDEATNYNYLLQLDDKLTSIRAQINNINKQIQMYDKSVALSYVYITLDEVVEYTEIVEEEPSFGSRIASTFVQSFKNFGVFCQELLIIIIWMLPMFMVIGIGAVVLIVLIRLRDKKKRIAYEEAKKASEAENEQK